MKEKVYVSLSTGTLVRFIALVILVTGLFFMRDLVITLLVAVVLASAMEPAIAFLKKYHFSRGIAVATVFVTVLALIGAFISFFVPPVAEDTAQFIRSLPALLQSVNIFGQSIGIDQVVREIETVFGTISAAQIIAFAKNVLFGNSGVFATTTLVIGGIVNLIITLIIAFYLASEEAGVTKFLRLVVPKRDEAYIEDLWNRSQRKIGLWMQGQLLLSVIVAVLVYIPLVVIDIPYAALLGLLAFIGELIPVVGITLAMIPALLVSFAHGGVVLLGVVFLIYFIISQLENHVLYPKVMNKVVGVPSVIVIISILIGASLAGFWGIVLSVPLAAVFMELVSDIDKRRRGESVIS